jgi:sigma-54 dependent transcriptional regulator, acetoin dehydrogenase operon transcriptional activator AcoR
MLQASAPLATSAHAHEVRAQQILLSRQQVLHGGAVNAAAGTLTQPWIERSWRRCLASGKRPEQAVSFDALPATARRRTEEANHQLAQAARPVMQTLGQAMASTRYFAILTNADGVVVDVNGPIDRRDRRADLISRIGVNLSEDSVGTTAIGAALAELQPVWLHRGEHFFNAHADYSCAGAPLFGADGRCAGMLDLTGVDAEERPELRHLVTQAARQIENALTQSRKHALVLRLNWSRQQLGDDGDGLVCVDADGWVTGCNSAARQMLPAFRPLGPTHCSELFVVAFEMLFDSAARAQQGGASDSSQAFEVPLWSGLRLNVLALPAGVAAPARRNALHFHTAPLAAPNPAAQLPLKDLEDALIRKAVNEARGNVALAAQTLGISRATVYRRLGGKR